MSRSTNRSSRRLPPLRGRLAAIASPKLRSQYAQATTYANLSRQTSKSIDSKAAGFKLTDSKLISTENNDLWESDELITINLPVTEVEVPEVEVFELAIPEAKVSKEMETKTNDSSLKPKAQRSGVEKSEQAEKEEKRLIALIVLLLILLTIGSSF